MKKRVKKEQEQKDWLAKRPDSRTTARLVRGEILHAKETLTKACERTELIWKEADPAEIDGADVFKLEQLESIMTGFNDLLETWLRQKWYALD
jgi:hypothetical protein